MTEAGVSAPAEQSGVARKTVQGIFWNYTSFGLGKGLVFLTTAILARLLTPEDFGLVAVATIAVDYLSILKDLGLGEALIQRRRDVEQAAHTVFTMNVILGLLLTGISVAVAPLVALYFRSPEVTPVLRWISLSFAINALGNTHSTRLTRRLEFRTKLVPDIGRSVVKGIFSIVLALLGMGVWSLVIGQLVGTLAGVILTWMVEPWRPRLFIDLRLARGMLGFGSSVIVDDALSIIGDNMDYVIIGRIFGESMLGIYLLAYRLPELLVISLLWILARTLFPAYAAIQDNPELLRRGFLTTIRFVAIISLPVCLGLGLVADPIIRVAFGPQWLEAIPVLRALAGFAFISSIGFNVGDVYKAVGRADILARLSIVNLLMLVPALWIGSRWGLVGVALGHVVVSVLYMVLRLSVATRFVQVSVTDILRELRPALVAGLALAVAVVPLMFWTAPLVPALRLAVAAAAGAAAYLGVLWLTDREELLFAVRKFGLPAPGA
jgi:PST family polysaccharide transporter